MKIGIVTLHYSKNYGAILQTYALCEFLKMNGFDAEVIDYCPKYAIKGWRLFINPLDCSMIKKAIYMHGFAFALKRIVQIIKFDLFFISRAKKYKKYREFENKIALSKRYERYSDLNNEIGMYGVLISGSDQVWNPNLINGYDPVYFLDIDNWNGVKISYAASSGIKGLTQTLFWKDMYQALKKIDLITVREKKLQEELSSVGLNSFVVVDPTLLVDKSVWNSLTTDFKSNKGYKEYILVYILENNPDFQKCIELLNRDKNLLVIDISPINNKIKAKKDKMCGPLDFLNYVKNATYVITDSFHGTVFSLIFNKNFWCIKRNKMFGRIETLLAETNLSARIFDSKTTCEIDENIDYSEIIPKIEKLQKESRTMLSDFLKNECNECK